MPIDKASKNTGGSNIPSREAPSGASSIEESSEIPEFNSHTVTQTEEPLSIKEQNKKNMEDLAKFYKPMSELSKKARKGIKRARLTMDKERMFPEKVAIGRMDDTPRMELKKDTLTQVTKMAIPALTVAAKNLVPHYGAKLEIPENLQDYFVFDPRNLVGMKDICLFGTANDLQAYLEKRDTVGVFSKISEDDGVDEIANIQKRYPIYAGVLSEYQRGKEVKIYNPRREIILKAIKAHIFVIAGLAVSSFAPPIDSHVKIPTQIAKTLRTGNRINNFINPPVKKKEIVPIKLTKRFVNFIAGATGYAVKHKKIKISKPDILKTKAEKLQKNIEKELEKELEKKEQAKNKILMLRISYMPQDGLALVGEREISLQDVGKKLGLIPEAKVLAEEAQASGIDDNSNTATDSGFSETMYDNKDSEFNDIIEMYQEYIELINSTQE